MAPCVNEQVVADARGALVAFVGRRLLEAQGQRANGVADGQKGAGEEKQVLRVVALGGDEDGPQHEPVGAQHEEQQCVLGHDQGRQHRHDDEDHPASGHARALRLVVASKVAEQPEAEHPEHVDHAQRVEPEASLRRIGPHKQPQAEEEKRDGRHRHKAATTLAHEVADKQPEEGQARIADEDGGHRAHKQVARVGPGIAAEHDGGNAVLQHEGDIEKIAEKAPEGEDHRARPRYQVSREARDGGQHRGEHDQKREVVGGKFHGHLLSSHQAFIEGVSVLALRLRPVAYL